VSAKTKNIFLLIAWILFYLFANRHAFVLPGSIPQFSLEQNFPFVPMAGVFYFVFRTFWPILSLCFFRFHDEKMFRLKVRLFVMHGILFSAVPILFPRSQYVAGLMLEGGVGKVLGFFYGLDSPLCAFPSAFLSLLFVELFMMGRKWFFLFILAASAALLAKELYLWSVIASIAISIAVLSRERIKKGQTRTG